ncbi:MAG: gliding motility protein GldN [Thermaurantimonas sp.]|uniref:type IX secretion system ring protein PorN/GldN n=1 Tax=Thermaurantimonas sp. TaxID=2681568 RepID=UPI00391A1894
MKNRIFLVVSLASVVTLSAQVLTPQDDGIIPAATRFHNNNKVFEYPYLREADLMWSTRHWERIDLKEKANFHLYYPETPLPDRKSLFNVLIDGILKEATIVDVFGDDRFEIPYTAEEVSRYVKTIDTIFNPDDPSKIDLIDTIEIKSKDVIAYYIKSDWYFDKQRGELKNRIIAIAPVVKNPRTKDIYPLFWVWFPDARYALATNTAFNRGNNMQRLTFDQVFHLRFFTSVIYKEENVYDRSIADYKRKSTLEQLLEGQQIREKLRNFENDLWEF